MPKIAATLFIAASAAFVLWLGHGLPGSVASHFGPGGRPDGAMSRGGFVAAMLAMATALPLALMILLPKPRSSSKPAVPAAGRWSAPASDSRHAASSGQAAAFAVALSAFMDFVSWRVAAANQAPGAAGLSPAPLWAGVAVFLAFLAAWGVSVSIGRSRR